MTLNKKIKEIRVLKNISLDKLSNLTGISKHLLSSYEEELIEIPDNDLLKISKALDISLSQLINDDKVNSSNNDQTFDKLINYVDSRKNKTFKFAGIAFMFISIFELIISNVVLYFSEKSFVDSSTATEVNTTFKNMILAIKIMFNVVGILFLIIGLILFLYSLKIKHKAK